MPMVKHFDVWRLLERAVTSYLRQRGKEDHNRHHERCTFRISERNGVPDRAPRRHDFEFPVGTENAFSQRGFVDAKLRVVALESLPFLDIPLRVERYPRDRHSYNFPIGRRSTRVVIIV